MRHAPACPCIGADEACFAALVADAAEGAREDAMLISTLIVRPDFAPAAAACAEELGVALRRATLTRGASVIHRSHVAAKLH